MILVNLKGKRLFNGFMSNANSDQNKGLPIRIVKHEVMYKYYVAQQGEADIRFVWFSQNSNKLT